jgi:hypothetical protein
VGVVVNYTYQSKPLATTVTDLYTVPVGRRANVKVWCTNQDAAVVDLWRLAIAPLGAADAVAQYVVFDEPLGLAGAVACSDERSGIRLRATDVIRVRSLNGDVSFTATVYEEDA